MNVIDPYFGQIFQMYSPEQQARTVDALADNIAKLRAHDPQTMRAMGIMRLHVDDPADAQEDVEAALTRCSWQMAQLLRFSTPSRVSEAEPHVRAVLAAYEQQYGSGAIDPEPALFLAVILHRRPGHASEAYALYNAAVAHPQIGTSTLVWAQAAMARMLRGVERVDEAREIEAGIVNWFKRNPAAMPLQAFRALVVDEEYPNAPNAILDDPVVKAMFGPADVLSDGGARSTGPAGAMVAAN